MEEIIKQSFNYAQIRLFKNYSNLDKLSRVDEIEDDESDPFGDTPKIAEARKYTVSAREKDKIYTLKLYPKDNNKKFFYASDACPRKTGEDGRYVHNYRSGSYELIKLVRANSICDSSSHDWFDTTKHRHIKHHYNNPFAGIKIHTILSLPEVVWPDSV